MKRTWMTCVVAVLCASMLASAFNEAFQYYAASAAPGPDADFPFWYGCTIDLASFVLKAAPALIFALVWKRSGFLLGSIIGFLGSIGRSALYMSQHGVPLTAGNFPALLCTAVMLAIIACVAGGAGELMSQRFSNYSSKRTREKPRAA